MYKVRVKHRQAKKPARSLYFKTWYSACEFCVLAGLRIKAVKAA